MEKKITGSLPAITLIIIYFIWLFAAKQFNSELIMPEPKLVFLDFIALLQSERFAQSLINTGMRTGISFLIAFAAALITAFPAAKSEIFKKLFYPVVVLMRAVPTMSVIILCLIWLKSSDSPLLIAFLIIYPMLYSAVYESVRGVDKDLIEMSKVYNVSAYNTVTKFYIPEIARNLYGYVITIFTFNVKIVISGEALAQTNLSLGGAMQAASFNIDTANVFAYTVAAVLLSYSIELLIRLIKTVTVRIVKR